MKEKLQKIWKVMAIVLGTIGSFILILFGIKKVQDLIPSTEDKIEKKEEKVDAKVEKEKEKVEGMTPNESFDTFVTPKQKNEIEHIINDQVSDAMKDAQAYKRKKKKVEE